MVAPGGTQGLENKAFRLRDRLVLMLLGFVGPIGALIAASRVMLRSAMGLPPSPDAILAAFAFVAIGIVMAWTRWRLLTGRRAVVPVAGLAIAHALIGAIVLRAATAPDVASAFLPVVAVYMLVMAAILAWCTYHPIHPPAAAGT